jgi:hypothetical protein
MPSQSKVLWLEKMRLQGAEINYPNAPWLNEYINKTSLLLQERDERIAKQKNASLLKEYPAKAGQPRDGKRPIRKKYITPIKFL